MIVEMEDYKFEVKRVTHLKATDTITPRYFAILYISWNIVTSLAWCHFWLQILTKKSIFAFEWLKSLRKQRNWYLSDKVFINSLVKLWFSWIFCVRIYYTIIKLFAKIHRNLLKKFEVNAYKSNWASFGVHNPVYVFWTYPIHYRIL